MASCMIDKCNVHKQNLTRHACIKTTGNNLICMKVFNVYVYIKKNFNFKYLILKIINICFYVEDKNTKK